MNVEQRPYCQPVRGFQQINPVRGAKSPELRALSPDVRRAAIGRNSIVGVKLELGTDSGSNVVLYQQRNPSCIHILYHTSPAIPYRTLTYHIRQRFTDYVRSHVLLFCTSSGPSARIYSGAGTLAIHLNSRNNAIVHHPVISFIATSSAHSTIAPPVKAVFRDAFVRQRSFSR